MLRILLPFYVVMVALFVLVLLLAIAEMGSERFLIMFTLLVVVFLSVQTALLMWALNHQRERHERVVERLLTEIREALSGRR